MTKQLFHRRPFGRVKLKAALQDFGHLRVIVANVGRELEGIVDNFSFAGRNIIRQFLVDHEVQ